MPETSRSTIATKLELVRPQIAADGNDLMESQGQSVFVERHTSGPTFCLLVYVIRGDRQQVRMTFAPDMGPGLHRNGDLGCFECRFPVDVDPDDAVSQVLDASRQLSEPVHA
jgi:hypothetical protein